METRIAVSTQGSSRRTSETTSTRINLPSPEEIEQAPSKAIPELVTAGWKLDAEIGILQERLGMIKARLVEEGKKRSPEGQDGTRESVELQGLEVGHVVTVSFPGDRLVSSFYLDKEGEAIAYVDDKPTKLGKLKEICGEHFKTLFFESWKPKSKLFRDLAVALLGKKAGPKLIEKVTLPSSPRVSFKSKAGG